MTTADYQILLPSLPEQPGIYRFIAVDEEILYIGKAKSLKKRIASYFGEKKDMRRKTRMMVRTAVRLEYTIVDTEQDALLLEATLIKKHQPRYNVALKHSRPYPYICIKKESFPRVMTVYKVEQDGSRYFGPYPSRSRMYTIIDLIKQLFKLRTCSLNLSKNNIEQNKFKVCLEYHIKNCLGPCVGLETEAEYNIKVEQVANILKGHLSSVKRFLKEQMSIFAEKLEFEKAAEIKVQLDAIEKYQGRSTVVHANIRDVDVFTIATDPDAEMAYVNYLKVVEGSIINTYTLELVQNLDSEKEDLLLYAIQVLREKFQSISPEVLIPFELSSPWPEVKFSVPQIGDKKKLMELSEKNAAYFLEQQQKQALARLEKKTQTEQILELMKKDLQLDELPIHIECFDNSNLQGTNPVSSCVVFKNAKPAKRDYRHYHVKTVEGPNDFASMEEVVFRRYRRLLDEGTPLPQLIIIDGGKGQLSAATVSLKALGIFDRVTVIGIAKRLEEIFFPDDPVPILLSKKSHTLKIIQQARDEAHRFAISFHRDIRSKNFAKTELNSIPGIGEKTAQKLLTHFGSVKKIKESTREEIESLVAEKIADKLIEYFNTYK
jgi:excinuclease ABC subunit C